MRRLVEEVLLNSRTSDLQIAQLPLGSKRLHVEAFAHMIRVYFEIDPDEDCLIKHRFRVVWTGKEFPFGGDHIGSVKIGAQVAHVFWGCELNPKAGGY